jgi:glutamine synthetase
MGEPVKTYIPRKQLPAPVFYPTARVRIMSKQSGVEGNTVQHILESLEKDGIKYLEYGFVNILGIPKEILIPIEGLAKDEIERLLVEGIAFDGSSVEGYATIEESDLIARPDLNTHVKVFSRDSGHNTAGFICDVFTPAGQPFSKDPRWVLKKTLGKYLGDEYTFNVGPELEFFLFRAFDDPENPRILLDDREGYFSAPVMMEAQDVKKEIISRAFQMGIPLEASHHEVAPSQHELDLKYGDAVTLADRIMLVKYLTKRIAVKHNLWATFMPKPIKGKCGNGMHVHMSLFDKEGNNVFYDPGDPEFHLSAMARHFVGGLIHHSKDICGVLASTINSYKRLVPGFEAPCYVSWGKENRSVLIRVPAAKGNSTRFEIRNPDPAGCQYLQFALLLAAGMEGVRNNIEPPEPVRVDVFKMAPAEREGMGIANLPGNLAHAMDLMAQSDLVRETLGEDLLRSIIHVKMADWDEYRTEVTGWEVRKYLPIL